MNNTTDILDENSKRTRGVDALTSNIEAAKAVSSIVKTTLGPMGMDKMLIDSYGNTIVTNDGVKILKEMEIEHPAAKLLVEVAKTQETEVGDGTTTAVILAGEQLQKAQELLNKKIHQTKIISMYNKGSKKALEILNENSLEFNIKDFEQVKEICETAITGKIAENSKEILSKIIYDSVTYIDDFEDHYQNRIKILKVPSGEIEDSRVINGIVLDKNLANSNMKRKIENSKILLIDFPLEIKELETDANINLASYKEYEEFVKAEQEYLISIVNKIKESGANVVICQKGIDDGVAYYLAKEGIIAVRRTRKSDLEKLSYALNTIIVNNENDINSKNLGKAELVNVKTIDKEDYVFIEGCENPKAITILLKASTTHVLDEIERALEDAMGDVISASKSKKKVAGGGAIEFELYKEINNYAKEFSGKEQLILQKYAESFLIIPKVLCENSGLDEIEIITNINTLHEKGKKFAGINSFKGTCEDTIKEGIVEPINIKRQAIKSAIEVCSMILRIDDIIASKPIKQNDEREF